ncbi:MAG TPA: histidinol-phosphatase HisJ family protein [Arcobacter sp.]|nr:histidinol-phosphatase HisJ family protein [Arcobacter sp.]
MIDSHTHSKYSKHAIGDIEEVVLSAIENGIKILTITDHAPFPIDENNRLLEDELQSYFDDISYVQHKYSKDITILKGLEVDFLPEYLPYIKKLVANIEVDFLIGSIHFIFLNEKRVNVWDIEVLSNKQLIVQYFSYLKELIESNLFDSIGHPDSLLRGGIDDKVYSEYFYSLIPLMKSHNISYELNASGLRKSTFDIKNKIKRKGIWNFPSKLLVSVLNQNNISFTIGSDSHTPNDVSLGIQEVLRVVHQLGVKEISYYKNRKNCKIDINDCINKE